MAYFRTGASGELSEDLTRRERRKLEVHIRILEASVELFQERGIENTKVLDICDRADVAHKTFFNHFVSRRHLLREIASYGLEQVLTEIEAARKQPASTRARIHHFFEGLADHADEAGPMHGELLTEMVAVSHESGREPAQARKLHDAFGAIIADGFEIGDINDKHSRETLTEMLMGAYYVLMFNWANLERYPLRERALDTARFLADSITVSTEGR
jgi:AcrR family transcriptional regulator